VDQATAATGEERDVRRRTAIALGGAMAGAVLAGGGGTLATFTDVATVSTAVGAGELALTVEPGASPLPLTPSASRPATVDVQRTGSGPVELWLSAIDGEMADSCTALPNAWVFVGGVADHTEVRAKLCDLVEDPSRIAVLADGVQSTQLTVRVTAVNAPGNGQVSKTWNGDLRFLLMQPGGGFSDQQDVPAYVSRPGDGNGDK
jgi:predicted ribosomally synthesized peptide with SipW-like signal peptide